MRSPLLVFQDSEVTLPTAAPVCVGSAMAKSKSRRRGVINRYSPRKKKLPATACSINWYRFESSVPSDDSVLVAGSGGSGGGQSGGIAASEGTGGVSWAGAGPARKRASTTSPTALRILPRLIAVPEDNTSKPARAPCAGTRWLGRIAWEGRL